MQTIALVLARGGSKRLPRKNLLRFGRETLVSLALRCGLECAQVDRVVLSTDDPKIAEEGRRVGAEVPFLRPAHLASDDATSADAALHALDALDIQDGVLVLLQPTSPLRTSADLSQVLTAKVALGLPCIVTTNTKREPNGAIYAIDVPLFRSIRSFYPPEVHLWEMPDDRSIDIDTAADFARAKVGPERQALDWDD